MRVRNRSTVTRSRLRHGWLATRTFCPVALTETSLVLWGAKDIAFRTKELERWKSELSQCEAHAFADCGHFVAEEAAGEVLPVPQAFLG